MVEISTTVAIVVTQYWQLTEDGINKFIAFPNAVILSV